ncbi:MAG: thiol:disulfide interchange protein DsbA/DsbL, partial [Sutterellaceae bacterium]|nr:thiol:disulfide interchange protein DsbA/DsbL [Sutterellaceae bacterium]
LKWVTAHGVNADQWKKTMASFAVVSKARSASQMWKNYGVDSTPCIGVAGRYITAPHLTGTRAGTIDVVKFLINQIRNEK